MGLHSKVHWTNVVNMPHFRRSVNRQMNDKSASKGTWSRLHDPFQIWGPQWYPGNGWSWVVKCYKQLDYIIS